MGIPKKERERYRNNIWKNNGWKHPKFNEIHDSTNPKSSIKSKQDKFQEMYTETHYKQTVQRQREKCKSSRKEFFRYKGASIRLADHFLSETLEARTQQNGIFLVLKDICQPRNLYLGKLSFKMRYKLRCSKINKSWGSSLPFYLPDNKS